MQMKRWNFKFEVLSSETSTPKTLNLKFWILFLESKKFYIWSYIVSFGDILNPRIIVANFK